MMGLFEKILVTFTNEPYLFLNLFVSIIVVLSSLLIFKRLYKFYKLSEYKGIKILSFAFLYLGIGFIFGQTPAYLIEILFLKGYVSANFIIIYYLVFKTLFFYFITIGLFSLVYSLIWKEFETYNFFKTFLNKFKFIKNQKELILYIDSLIVTILALYNELYWFLIVFIIFIYASFTSYNNYINLKKKGNKNKFSQFYTISIFLGLIGFSSNFLLGFFPNIEIYSDLILVLIFILFLWGTYRISENVR